MSRHQGSGALPPAQQMAAYGLLQGSMAYKAAQQAALKGVDPEAAAQYGVAVSGYRMAFWVYAPLTGLFAVCALRAGGLLTLWGLGHIALLVWLHHRLKAFQETDPRYRLRYRIGTGWVVVAALVWMLLVPVGIVQALWISPQQPKVVHIQPTTPRATQEYPA